MISRLHWQCSDGPNREEIFGSVDVRGPIAGMKTQLLCRECVMALMVEWRPTSISLYTGSLDGNSEL
jgi:hypothetical protein